MDLAWPERKVAVQVHGSTFHRQLRTWEKDQRVENELQLQGWVVVKITPRMIEEDPEFALDLVERALRSRRPMERASG